MRPLNSTVCKKATFPWPYAMPRTPFQGCVRRVEMAGPDYRHGRIDRCVVPPWRSEAI